VSLASKTSSPSCALTTMVRVKEVHAALRVNCSSSSPATGLVRPPGQPIGSTSGASSQPSRWAPGRSSNDEHEYEHCLRGAENGDSFALFKAGVMRVNGQGTPKNIALGLRMMAKAASVGDPEARRTIARMQRTGQLKALIDKAKAKS